MQQELQVLAVSLSFRVPLLAPWLLLPDAPWPPPVVLPTVLLLPSTLGLTGCPSKPTLVLGGSVVSCGRAGTALCGIILYLDFFLISLLCCFCKRCFEWSCLSLSKKFTVSKQSKELNWIQRHLYMPC
jgi:hypothetical protein